MAEQKTFHVTIAKVDAPVFDGDAVSVTLPGKEGDMTVLAHHTAIISPLRKGMIVVKTDGGEATFEAESGTMEMSGNDLTILI